jgi:hypothetical protein
MDRRTRYFAAARRQPVDAAHNYLHRQATEDTERTELMANHAPSECSVARRSGETARRLAQISIRGVDRQDILERRFRCGFV